MDWDHTSSDLSSATYVDWCHQPGADRAPCWRNKIQVVRQSLWVTSSPGSRRKSTNRIAQNTAVRRTENRLRQLRMRCALSAARPSARNRHDVPSLDCRSDWRNRRPHDRRCGHISVNTIYQSAVRGALNFIINVCHIYGTSSFFNRFRIRSCAYCIRIFLSVLSTACQSVDSVIDDFSLFVVAMGAMTAMTRTRFATRDETKQDAYSVMAYLLIEDVDIWQPDVDRWNDKTTQVVELARWPLQCLVNPFLWNVLSSQMICFQPKSATPARQIGYYSWLQLAFHWTTPLKCFNFHSTSSKNHGAVFFQGIDTLQENYMNINETRT